MKDYYEILGVSPDATQEEIKAAFRELAQEHHPDHGGDEEKFKEINEVYTILSDPGERSVYDETQGLLNPAKKVSRSGFDKRILRVPISKRGVLVFISSFSGVDYFEKGTQGGYITIEVEGTDEAIRLFIKYIYGEA